ncbi:uncharacterized protein VTP21DRAFT_245 [Calcarisporiella thermophila]|uniref:uncharacterized protein n=1 Tax=Calcarisporiella thermophila TaxID=911321 RepID=UPI0037427324
MLMPNDAGVEEPPTFRRSLSSTRSQMGDSGMPARSYVGTHNVLDAEMAQYSASPHKIREQSLALGDLGMKESPTMGPRRDAESTESLDLFGADTLNKKPVASNIKSSRRSNLSLLLQEAERHQKEEQRGRTTTVKSTVGYDRTSYNPPPPPPPPPLPAPLPPSLQPPSATESSTVLDEGPSISIGDDTWREPLPASYVTPSDYSHLVKGMQPGHGSFWEGWLGSDKSRKAGTEQEPLLGNGWRRQDGGLYKFSKCVSPSQLLRKVFIDPITYVPAVILGLLLNLLDAISYGMITFPLNMTLFSSFGPDGISMFFVSCIVSQLVFSLGGSAFAGANGSMMIEVVPFLHLIAETIVSIVGEDKPHEAIATTILAFAISSILTGLVFLALGAFKLGSLIEFFPRHILVGCIGGVGWFLVVTGVEVSARLKTNLTYTLPMFRHLFLDGHVFALWFSAFSLALLLRFLQSRIQNALLVPLFFMAIPVIFYVVIAIGGWPMEDLRRDGWIFPMPKSNVPFYHFYQYFDFRATNWEAIAATIPAMLALTFFGILHVPVNLPALQRTTGQEDVDTNRELVAHGLSNMISGLAGSVQNYLVYTNSVLFMRCGGDSRVAGLMLAGATLVIFLVGPWVVGYVPVMIVGALIFHLGIDLIKEAVLDTWGIVHPLEYLTILAIIFVMAVWGFIEGIFAGIIMACVFFVVMNSRKSPIRAIFSGASAQSTVRRLYRQQQFLRQVASQILVMKLQGFMFFGTVNALEGSIKAMFAHRQWQYHPIRFLVLDFQQVNGIDFSAAEAFIRIRRLLRAKDVYMVLCGLTEGSDEARALQGAGIWSSEEDDIVQTFENLNGALEWCENSLLQQYYRRLSVLAKRRQQQTGTLDVPNARSYNSDTGVLSQVGTPRGALIDEATRLTMQQEAPLPQAHLAQPFALLWQVFQDISPDMDHDLIYRLGAHFEGMKVERGRVLWNSGDEADALYVVEHGLLRVIHEFGLCNNDQDAPRAPVEGKPMFGESVSQAFESILPGTMVGELSLFANRPHSTRLVADMDSDVWCLKRESFDRMCKEDPSTALSFVQMSLSYPSERVNAVTRYAFHIVA